MALVKLQLFSKPKETSIKQNTHKIEKNCSFKLKMQFGVVPLFFFFFFFYFHSSIDFFLYYRRHVKCSSCFCLQIIIFIVNSHKKSLERIKTKPPFQCMIATYQSTREFIIFTFDFLIYFPMANLKNVFRFLAVACRTGNKN